MSEDKPKLTGFRAFYIDRNPQFRGQWPCPFGTDLLENHRARADTLADWADYLAGADKSAI